MEEEGSQTLRLTSGAGLSEGDTEVGDWFCESCTAKHCLDGHFDPGIVRLSQNFEAELKGWRFMHCADLEAIFVTTAALSSKQHR